MHSLAEHWDPPYIEIEIFGRYPENYLRDIEAISMRYASQYDAFGVMEIHHGKPSNGLWRLFQTGGRISDELRAAFKKIRCFAIVADDHATLFRLLAALPRFGSAELRLFKLHELDDAIDWVSEQVRTRP